MKNTLILQCAIHQRIFDAKEKDIFCEQFNTVQERLPKGGLVTVIGNLNTK